jgi:hypothetical protein
MASTAGSLSAAPIRRRLVCFLSGFDPRGPAHYHALYQEAAAAQAQLGGYQVEVGPRTARSAKVSSWTVKLQSDGITTDTRYDFLRWDDIVRQHWPKGRTGAWRAAAFASWHLWRDGVMWHALRTSWPSFVVMATPGLLLVALALSLLVGLGLLLAMPAAQVPVALAGLVVFELGLGALAWRTELRAHMGWLCRSMASLVHLARGEAPDIDARLDEFAKHVREGCLGGEFDEVLVVGHSSGAMMAMSVLGRALRIEGAATAAITRVHLGLLTLGHCAPVLAEQPGANRFRADLSSLVSNRDLCWIDYGAPPDGCCFPLVDPSASVAPGPQPPRLLNPRFASLFSSAGYRALRADYFRCHFQYLMAGELRGDYDYVACTAGPASLAQRHQGRASVHDFRKFRLFSGAPR